MGLCGTKPVREPTPASGDGMQEGVPPGAGRYGQSMITLGAPVAPTVVEGSGATGGAAPTVYVIRGPGSEIWTHADSLLQNTWMKHGVYKLMQMTEVQEIQNTPMRDRYEAYKAGMREGVVNGNEMLVFHGCGADAIESIAEKGFLKSFQNTAAWQRFGPGFYFALQVGFRVCLSLSL